MPSSSEAHEKAIVSDSRWGVVLARDRNADGLFFYAVTTTGIFCRPSCGARTPLPKNVLFFTRAEDAKEAGFRPCKRCKPGDRSRSESHSALVTALCRRIEESEDPLDLNSLAREAHMSPFHLHRLFKSVTGVTPRSYQRAHRAEKVRKELLGGARVTDAIYAAGYQSGGHFYAESDQILGMTPGNYRNGGVNRVIHFAVGECSLGTILIAMSARGLCAIMLGEDPDSLIRSVEEQFPKADLIGDNDEFTRLVGQVVGFVENPGLGLDLPLDIRGTAFQRRVWEALQKIPSGTTASYSDIARRIGASKAVRAVASACAANPLAVAIPCHRVVRKNGDLSGYRWGIDRKRSLLERESRLSSPSSE